jgi:hypothetical protein
MANKYLANSPGHWQDEVGGVERFQHEPLANAEIFDEIRELQILVVLEEHISRPLAQRLAFEPFPEIPEPSHREKERPVPGQERSIEPRGQAAAEAVDDAIDALSWTFTHLFIRGEEQEPRADEPVVVKGHYDLRSGLVRHEDAGGRCPDEFVKVDDLGLKVMEGLMGRSFSFRLGAAGKGIGHGVPVADRGFSHDIVEKSGFLDPLEPRSASTLLLAKEGKLHPASCKPLPEIIQVDGDTSHQTGIREVGYEEKTHGYLVSSSRMAAARPPISRQL